MYSAPAWPEREIALSWSSTSPPAPNQERPLWAKEGQPWTSTVTIIASSSPTTAPTSAPSIPSTRWSDHRGPYSGGYSSSNLQLLLLVERGHATGLADHFTGQRAEPHPVDELGQCRRAGAAVARQDDEQVARERVLERFDADLLRFAGDAVDFEGLELLASLPGETGVADRVFVLL